MNPAVIKYRIWNLALRMNPQSATYYARTIATTPGGTDSLSPYNLTRVVYRELTTQEQAMAQATLADVYKVWTITQVDLDQAQAPTPMIGFELKFADGTTWVMDRVTATVMNQAFECLCHQGRPQ